MKSKIKAKKSKKVKKIKDGDDLLDGPEDEDRNPSDDSSSDDEVTKQEVKDEAQIDAFNKKRD